MRRWWIISALAATLVVAGIAYWGYNQSLERQQIVTLMNNRNQRAFFEMVGNVQNMEVMLSKGIVSGSPKQRMLIFADIWQQANSAQENLTQVPMTGRNLTRTSKFLAQTGDFAWSLAKKYARGQSVTSTELAQLNVLHREAGFLASELNKITRTANNGLLTWGEVRTTTKRQLAGQPLTVPDGLGEIDKNMEDFPTLIYDGPFSDHVTNRKPVSLPGEAVSRSEAGNLAEKFVESGSKTDFRVVKTESVNGNIPAFRIYLSPQNADNPRTYVDVSKKGGHVLSMLNNRDVNRDAVSPRKAIEIAARFMANQNGKMVPTYMVEQQNTGTVIFEYKQNDVLVYPDLMKVKVALDNGEVIGFDAVPYVMNHRDRNIPKPKVSEKQARSKVNPKLSVTSGRLALIPLEDLKEVLVYEFRGTIKGDVFLVYINAMTGDEEQILKVIETNGGPVTI